LEDSGLGTFVVDDCIRLPAGDGRIGLVDARDVAAVGVEALITTAHDGKAYILSTESLSHAEVAEQLSVGRGRSIKYKDIPQKFFSRNWRLRDGLRMTSTQCLVCSQISDAPPRAGSFVFRPITDIWLFANLPIYLL
jgi:hypothetical protein